MAINFPAKWPDGESWPAEGDHRNLAETKGVIFKYDRGTNSWDIVGPDNIATTDWVLGQKADDTTNLERAYDLVTATNDIGVDAGYNTKQNTICDNTFEQTLRGGVSAPNQDPNLGGDGKDVEEVLEYAFPDWTTCVSAGGLGAGSMAFIGYDHYTADPNVNSGDLSTLSYKYSEIAGFIFTSTDKDDNPIDWFGDVATDDTIEVSFEGSTGNTEYIIYTISHVTVVDSTRTSIRVRYVGSSHPDQEFRITGQNTYYQLRTYKRSVTTAGATFDGPIRVKQDDQRALTAKPKDTAAPDTFNVDTTTGKVSASHEYSVNIGTPGFEDTELLVTYGYINTRLGPDEPGLRGPWLPLSGGIMDNYNGVIIKAEAGGSNNGKTFTIRGKTSTSSAGQSELLTVKSSGNVDYLSLNSTVDGAGDAVLNRTQIAALISSGADTTEYLPLSGGKMKSNAVITGISTSINSANDSACSKAYADSKEFVHNGSSTLEGQIWTDGSTLFFNPYS